MGEIIVMNENEKSKVLIVLGSLCSVGIAVMIFFCVKYFFTMEISKDNINTNSFLLFSDQNKQILTNILKAESFSDGVKPFIKILLVSLSGTLAWVINYVFAEIPINIPRKGSLLDLSGSDSVGKLGYGILQLLPGIIMGIYLGIVLFFSTGELLNKDNFSLLFKNYTVLMVISQIVYIVAFLCLICLILEAFFSSGILGLTVRLPLMAVSNFSTMLTVCVLVYLAFIAAMCVLGIIIIIAFLDVWSRPKVYIKY